MLDCIVLHNCSRDMFFRYDPETSRLFHAHTFQIEWQETVGATLDLIYEITNIDSGPYTEQVAAYRERKNRSLSVGDVVVLMEGERFITAASVEIMGFKFYDEMPAFDMSDLHNARPESLAREALVEFTETAR